MPKKIISLVICVLLLASCLLCVAGCVGSDDDGSGTKYGKRARTFTFSYYSGGYGTAWLDAVIDDYMTNVNTDVYISLKRNSNNETTRTNIETGIGTYDLYQIEVDMFGYGENGTRKANVLADLSELYEMEVYGESGVKVKDKLGSRWVDYYKEGDSWYQLPQTQLTGWNWTYNKTLLDATLGEGAYTLPRTTDEFFEFGETLYNEGVYLTAFPGDNTRGGDYTSYAYELWFAQMLGLEGYEKYMSGYYQNDSGEWVFAEDAPYQVQKNSTAITEAYKVAQTLCSKGTPQYMHRSSASMDYQNIDVMLYGGKYRGQDVAPIAFSYVGAWLETEVQDYIEEEIISADQEVVAMKMPVISAITSRTPTITSDEMLAQVVDYVDGVTTTAPAGVSDDDIAIVREARNMVSELICRQFVVTESAKNKEDIMDFLAYLVSDRAQMIAAKATLGISVLPYGYTPTDEDMGFEMSAFTKSVQAIAKDAVIVDLGGLNIPYKSALGVTWYVDSKTSGGTLSLNLFTGQAESYTTIATSTYNNINSNYTTLMKAFKTNYPELFTK